MKKRNQKLGILCGKYITLADLVGTTGAKVNCAKFSPLTHQLFASGDDKNFVCVYRMGLNKPLQTFTSSAVSSSAQVVEVSAVCFGPTEEDLFTGSNRGIINVWDLGTGKQSQTLKGHLASVNALAQFPSEDSRNMLLSGAYDTLVKLWDLRQRSQVSQFKGHSNQINCLAVSPDTRIMASGSHDGTLKVWDIANISRPLTTFLQHDAPVMNVKYNPVDKALASGGNDRTVKYWDLDSYSLITSTRPDATPIQSILFEPQGKYLFSAAHESLKIWNLERDGSLLDNVESSWRGVHDLCLQQDSNKQELNNPSGFLYGLASHGQQGLQLYCLSLGLVNFDSQIPQDRAPISSGQRVSGPRMKTPDHKQNQGAIQNQQQIKHKPTLSNNARNILNDQHIYQLPQTNQSPAAQKLPPLQHQPDNNDLHRASSLQEEVHQSYQQVNLPMSKPTRQQFNQDVPSINQNTHGLDEEPINEYFMSSQPFYQNNQNSTSFLNPLQHQVINMNANMRLGTPLQQHSLPAPEVMHEEVPMDISVSSDMLVSNAELNFSSFISGDSAREKFKQIDMIGEIAKEHLKVMQILKGRESYMKPIVHWWNAGNARSAVNAIVQINEPNILLDAIMMLAGSTRMSKLGLDLLPGLIDKSRILIESRYMSHIRGGLEFVQQVMNNYSDELMSVKGFVTLSKLDLAREERIRKCDKVIEQLKVISSMPKILKIIERNREEVSEFTKRLQIQLQSLLKKVSQAQN